MSSGRSGRLKGIRPEELSMPTLVVQYRTKPECADENQRLLHEALRQCSAPRFTGHPTTGFGLG